MKKHPIDDIFRKKLEEVERVPSASAWDRIAPKKKEQRLPAMAWFLAAGVAVSLMAGYMVWMNEANDVKPELAVHTEIPVNTYREAHVKPEKDNGLPADKTDLIAKKSEAPVRSKKVATVDEKLEKRSTQHVMAAIEAVTSKDEQALTVPEDLKYPEIELQVVAAHATPAEPGRTEKRTIVVNVSETDSEPEPEKSRLGKIFRQLKNVKHGNSVDWREVGFNPKALVARVDGRLRDSEERVSEKYQNLKEKTKF
jgi:hypothetical protein